MLTKTKLKEQIEKLPEEFSINELVERLILIEKTENGINPSEHKVVVSETNGNPKPIQKQILSFAGSFADMDQKDYNNFVEETKKIRSSLFDRDGNL